MSGNVGSGSGGASPYDDHNDGGGGGVTPLPDFNASNIRLSTVAPAFGIPSSSLSAGPGSAHLSSGRQPDYLDYNQEGRGIVSTMFTNSGISYLLGVSLGGLYGLREGLYRTPSSRWKVKLNSVLNHCGRHGSGLGNMMGSTAILYSLYEGVADTVSIMCRSGDAYCLIFRLEFISPCWRRILPFSIPSPDLLFFAPPIASRNDASPGEMKKNAIMTMKIERSLQTKTKKRINGQLNTQYELDRYTGPIQPPAPLFAAAATGATYYVRAGPRVATLAGAIGATAVAGTFALYSVLGIPYGSKGWLFF